MKIKVKIDNEIKSILSSIEELYESRKNILMAAGVINLLMGFFGLNVYDSINETLINIAFILCGVGFAYVSSLIRGGEE